MQTIIKTNKTANFTIVDNSIINADLSALARMALVYLLSKPSTWKLRPTDIKRHLGIGINKVYRLLRELREAGYIVMQRIQSAVQWFVYDTPQVKTETATGRAVIDRDGFHHDGNGDDLVRTEGSVKTEKPQQHAPEPEPITAPATPNVVVQDGVIDQQATTAPTPTKAADDTQQVIAGIPDQHQTTARRALSRLTEEQAQMVLAAFTLQASKSNISNRVGYLVRLVQSAIDGTFSPVQAAQAAPTMTAGERIARERQRQQEAATRGKMSNQQYFEWLAREYGDKAEKQPGSRSIKALLGWS